MTFHILQTPTLDYRYNSAETDHSEGDEIPKFLTNYVKQDDESNEKETEKLLVWMQQLTQEEEEITASPDVSKIFSQSSSILMSQEEEEVIMLSQEEKEQEEEEKEFFHLDKMEEDDEDPDEIMNAIMESQAIFESHWRRKIQSSYLLLLSQTLSYPMAGRRRKRWKRRTRVQNHDENSFKVVIKVLRRKSCD